GVVGRRRRGVPGGCTRGDGCTARRAARPVPPISPGGIRLAPSDGRPSLLASRLPPVPVRPVPRSYHQRYLLARRLSIVEPGLGAAGCPCRSASSSGLTILAERYAVRFAPAMRR